MLSSPTRPSPANDGAIGPILRLLREEGARHAGGYALAALFMAAVAASTAFAAYLMKPVVDGMVVAGDLANLNSLALAVAGLFVLRGAATYGYSVTLARIGNAVVARCQTRVFDHLLRQDVAAIRERGTADTMTRLVVAANGARDVLQTLVVSVGRDVLSLLGLVVVMVLQDPLLAGIALLAMPIAAGVLGQMVRRVRRFARSGFDGTTRILGTMLEAAQGARVVKSFGLEDAMRARMAASVAEVRASANRFARVANLAVPLADVLGGLAVAIVIAYGSWRVTAGGGTPGTFFSFITALLMAYEPARRLGKVNLDIQQGLVGVRLLHEVLDAPAREDEPPGKPALQVREGRVAFEGVRFGYREGQAVLDGLDLVAEPGGTTALVGASGAGKSTILSLLLRFERPEAGRITIDGQSIADVDLASLRGSIGYVAQDVYLFEGSVRDNIALGRPGATDAEIVTAAHAANAHDFVSAFPRGYDTPVGELGGRLSGGQRQRIAIARAVLKDAPILLLDEPTAALDPVSEREVQRALDALKAGRTTLVVAHRLSTVRSADRICVIERGRVIEDGTHVALLARGGAYAALQAGGELRPEPSVAS